VTPAWRRSGRRRPGEAFRVAFERHLAGCRWEPHPRYNVFTQIDRDFYLTRRDAFVHKYRCFWAVARTIAPRSMIELGVCAGAGADAYLSGWPEAAYLGIDTFGEPFTDDDGSAWRELRVDEDSLWKPHDLAGALLADRGFGHAELMVANLRHLERLPRPADLVVVDAAHDYENQYADLRLALTAEPAFVFVDDVDGAETAQAVKQFVEDDLGGRAEFEVPIDYIGGGLVIKLP
jgi:predicted O-methyltransferase YrrM